MSVFDRRRFASILAALHLSPQFFPARSRLKGATEALRPCGSRGTGGCRIMNTYPCSYIGARFQ